MLPTLQLSDPDELLVIVGPTASGKTELAVELAASLNAEVINADSVQVYRYFDIGSGKPSAAEIARAPHHLLGILDPLEAIDAAQWAERANVAIAAIRARGKRPIVCGGTFLWTRGLLFGLAAAPAGDPEIRARHKQLAESAGRAELHRALAAVDPVSATRLNANDLVRVSRALEVFEISGKRLSEWHAEHGFRESKHKFRLVGVARDAASLDARILKRVQSMLQAGFIDEVRDLRQRGFENARAMGAVGYKQISQAIAQNQSLDEARLCEEIWRATRIFARRQRTWLRAASVEWVHL